MLNRIIDREWKTWHARVFPFRIIVILALKLNLEAPSLANTSIDPSSSSTLPYLSRWSPVHFSALLRHSA